jgi:hypothetical protein
LFIVTYQEFALNWSRNFLRIQLLSDDLGERSGVQGIQSS